MRLRSRMIGQPGYLPDLVPLVNVVLLLTFFFLLSWSFVLQPGVEVRLPATDYSRGSPQGRHIITLKNSPQGNLMIFFDEKFVSEHEFTACLSEAAKKKRWTVNDEWITLNADEFVSHGNVQRIAAMAMERGLRVTIATQYSSVRGQERTP